MNIPISTPEQKLLYAILEELKEIKSQLMPAKEPALVLKTEIQCKYCGGTHRNRQSMAACAKKKKKEGNENVSTDRSKNKGKRQHGT